MGKAAGGGGQECVGVQGAWYGVAVGEGLVVQLVYVKCSNRERWAGAIGGAIGKGQVSRVGGGGI